MVGTIGTVRSNKIVAIRDREQWQAKLSQRYKDSQTFVARGPTTMHENGPCAELARHIPGWHHSQWIWYPYLADGQPQVIFHLPGVYIACPEDQCTCRKWTCLLEKLTHDRIGVRGKDW